MKRTKIVCTIGPATETKARIEKMVRSGLNVCRLNFSHGTYKHHRMLVRNIRSVSKKLNQPVAILQDLQGPRIRIGDIGKEGIKVKKGQKISLVQESFKIPKNTKSVYIPIQYDNLYQDVKSGHRILIDDAKVELKIVSVKNKMINCKVKIGDIINTHKGMNFPKSQISTPAITEKDKKDLKFGLSQNVDFVSLSFVKDAGDIKKLRSLISQVENKKSKNNKEASATKIIAKIERPEAVENFEKILEEVDGIMVARGDLGLEIPLQDLPLIQKRIIRRCIQKAKPVIVATQMLDSMIRYPMPTRAEVTDVANAILDGTDGIMLSGETATGKYPIKAVQIMSKIAGEIEGTEISEHEEIEDKIKTTGKVSGAVSYAVQDIAEDINAKLIVGVTISGSTVRSISKYRSKVPIVAFAVSAKTKNQLCLSWGVSPYEMSVASSTAELISNIKKLLLQNKLVKKGDTVVISASDPVGYTGETNLIKVEKI